MAFISYFVGLVACVGLWKLFSYIRMRIASSVLNTIPSPPAKSFWNGNLSQFLSRHGASFQKHVALDFGPIVKINGFLGTPILYVADPKALHTMLIKDEAIFQETEDFISLNKVLFGASLLSTLGSRHGKQRKLLNPVFSLNHMRYMLPLFYDVVGKLRDAIGAVVQDESHEVDVLSWMGRTALELIGQGGLGYSFDPLVENREDAYGGALKAMFLSLYQRLITISEKIMPKWMRRAVVNMFPTGSRVNRLANIIDTMDARAAEIYSLKKDALAKGDAEVVAQIGRGKDILSTLMRANMAADAGEKLPDEEVIAQMSTLIFAAVDTTSNALSRTLHLLAENPNVQQKLRQELLEAHAADGLSYDELNRLPFLDGLCRETLRLYPPVTILFRVATKDTILPLSEPIHTIDGKSMTEIYVPKGTQLLVGFLGCNTNKAMWGEDHLEWKPERWLSPLPSTVTESRVPGVYSNLMTFSGGKRACIGFKFPEMEMKIVLSILVSTFTFNISDKPIAWNVASVWFPTVGKDGAKPSLPLRVGRYKPAQH